MELWTTLLAAGTAAPQTFVASNAYSGNGQALGPCQMCLRAEQLRGNINLSVFLFHVSVLAVLFS